MAIPKKSGRLPWGIFLALFLLAASCGIPPGDEAAATGTEADTPDAVFLNYQREEVKGGTVTFFAKAEKVEYYQDQGKLVLHNIYFEDRGEDGIAVNATGEAEKAVYFEDTQDAELSGFVRIESRAEDVVFETASLKYRSATQTLEGGMFDPVIVRVGSKIFMHGNGFFADVKEKAFAFRNGAQGTMWPGK